jgi:hypothetical protein
VHLAEIAEIMGDSDVGANTRSLVIASTRAREVLTSAMVLD